MGHSQFNWMSVAIVAAIAALVFAIACGDDAPEPAPTVDTAKLVQDAVASAQSASAAEIQKSVAAAIAAQPQGASAAEIQKLVSDSVTAAIAAQPAGLTRAEIQSIVSESTAGQLSASDVKAIVDQSIRALPAPEVDVSRLSSLVNSAIAGAVPEGVSADEISRIVQAQVRAGLSGTLTRGDIEDLVAQAVEDAVGDQLTVDQVTNIVNASLVATNQAIENAAAEAAQAAAEAARESATPSGPPVQVVATTNFVADWARVVGGDRAEVFSLLQPGADPHTFLPGARDVARVADADVVFTVGLSLEAEWLEELLHNASADESKIVALGEGVDPIEFAIVGMQDDHGDEGDDHDEGDDDHDEMAMGRLLVADAVEAHLSVIDLSTENVESGIFEVAAPRATVYPSPTHRYGIVLARGPEDGDDRVHVFDGGVFLAEHGDHYDLVQDPVSRHSLEITEERPIHYVNSHGWTAIFADAQGHAILINEADLADSSGDYEPIVFEAGPQHGAALVISDDHVVITNKNLDDLDDALPVGVEVRDFDDHVVYDASNRSCRGRHGESHNEYGAAFGCIGGVLFLDAHDGKYEHEFIANPPEMREDSRIGSLYGHHHVENFFGRASYRDDQGFADDGIWLIDVDHSEMRQVFSEPSVATKFSSDGELLYVLGADGVLHALDAHDGDLVATMDLVEPGESGRPAFIVVGEMMYVADPNSGHVLAVHLEEMEIEEE
ncbi:MAG: zinc ABC transporter substrate-binding protein, partial [Chloroflexi bacterium]|nr:zinc ABC transporter substrate-binding protein [Chloroflexota bacterium]